MTEQWLVIDVGCVHCNGGDNPNVTIISAHATEAEAVAVQTTHPDRYSITIEVLRVPALT